MAFEPSAQGGFCARGAGYGIDATAEGVVLRLAGRGGNDPVRLRPASLRPLAFAGEGALPGVSHHLCGPRSNWRTHVPHYARVRARAVFPGVDLVLYGNAHRLEYDFEVAPGADVTGVEFTVEGARVALGGGGQLVLTLDGCTLEQPRPFAYQESGGVRRPIDVAYVTRGAGRFGFRVGEHDATLPLVIDPVLVYASYLGGNGMDRCADVAVDATGAAYLVGVTAAADFPATAGAFDPSLTGIYDAFVAKVSPDGSTLLWATYLGGSGAFNTDADVGLAVGVDAGGRAVVLGRTDAPDFPTRNAFQPALAGNFDAFVAMLTPDGANLVWSTYLGGSGHEITQRGLPTGSFGGDLAVLADGTTYVFGNTDSADFPLRAARQNARLGSSDGFLTRFDPAGQVVFSTYHGGSSFELGRRIVLDSSGNIVIAGDTTSSDYPVTPGTYAGTGGGFVTKLDPLAQNVLWSTRFPTVPLALGLDPSDAVYLGGTTRDPWFPVTAGAWQTTYSAASDQSRHGDGWVAKLDSAASALLWCTYLGTFNVPDSIPDLAVDATGHVHAMFNGTAVAGGPAAGAKVVQLASDGAGVCHELRFAGTSGAGVAIALSAAGSRWLAGFSTEDVVQTTPGSFQPIFVGPSHVGDGWIVRVDDALSGVGTVKLGTPKLPRGTTTTGTVTIDGRAPAGGYTVALAATPTGVLSLPATVVVPAGASTARFVVRAETSSPRVAVTVAATAGGRTATTTVSVWPGPSYHVLDLGPLGGVEAHGINDAGQTAGLGGNPALGFVHDDVNGFVGVGAALAGINERGQACGTLGTSAMLYTPGTGLSALPLFAGAMNATAEGLNDLGGVAGWAELAPLGYSRAFRYLPGTGMVNLGTLGGGSASTAHGINNRNDVCGESFVNGGAARRAFLYRDGFGMVDLGTLAGHAHATAYAINDAGEIAGISADSGYAAPHACRWSPAGIRDLGTLGGDQHSLAFGINEHGQCVGFSARSGAVDQRAMVATDLAGMVALQDELDPEEARRFILVNARAIDGAGRIAGVGTSGATAGTAAFRLDPVGAGPYGRACAGTGGRAPALCGEGSTARGEDFAFRLAGGPAGGAAALLLGTASGNAGLGGGCTLLVAGQLASPLLLALDQDGRASLPLRIPPSLPQATLFAQALVHDAGSGNRLLTASNGLELRLR